LWTRYKDYQDCPSQHQQYFLNRFLPGQKNQKATFEQMAFQKGRQQII